MTRTKTRALANWPNNAVSVLDFGAVGDGVTDDTAAIQAAVDNAGPNAVVYLPAGNYVLTASVSITTSLRIAGAGKGLSRFTYEGIKNTYAFSVEATDVVIENLAIYVSRITSTDGSVICLKLTGPDVSGLRLTNLYLKGQVIGGVSASHGVTFDNAVQADHCIIDHVSFVEHNFALFTANVFGATGNSARYWTFRDCTVENCKRGFSFNSDLDTSGSTDAWQHVIVEACYFLGTSPDYDRCTSVGGDSCLNLTVSNCVFRGRRGTDGCIHIENHMDNTVITGNTIYDCDGGIVLYPLSSRFLVSNNNITIDPSVDSTPATGGIPVTGQFSNSGITIISNDDGQTKDASITNNIIYGAEGGIYVAASTTFDNNSSISNNRIIRCNTGFVLLGDTNRCIIDRNTYVECGNGIEAKGNNSSILQYGGSKPSFQNCEVPLLLEGPGTTAPLVMDSPIISSSFDHTGNNAEAFVLIKKPIQAEGIAYITTKSGSAWYAATSQLKIDESGPTFDADRSSYSGSGAVTVPSPVFETSFNYLKLRSFSASPVTVSYTVAFSGYMYFSTVPVSS